MKKSIKNFENKKVKNPKAIKGGNINTCDGHIDTSDDETKQVKFRRVTFKLL